MNVYDAIMRAADHIENHPEKFDFHRAAIPIGDSCGNPRCALGWIGAYLSPEQREHPTYKYPSIVSVAKTLGFADTDAFYNEMRQYEGWTYNAKICASSLRLYAAKYHAPSTRTDSELVAAMMIRVMGERISEDA